MALSTIAGFNVGGTEPIDKRLVLTKAEMLAFDDSLMPSDYLCMCSDDHKMYQYNKNNTVDSVTGKFRVFEGGGSSIQVETLPTASATELGKIYQFIGTSTENYLNGSFYKCVTDGTDYSWVSVDTFPSWRGTSSELEEALEDLPTGTRIEVTDDYDEGGGGGTVPVASQIDYDSTSSGLSASNVQGAIDELSFCTNKWTNLPLTWSNIAYSFDYVETPDSNISSSQVFEVFDDEEVMVDLTERWQEFTGFYISFFRDRYNLISNDTGP